ncbi:MAG: hypothetical protein M3Q48_04960 [Actinomycetota bacterium]|nr:hypothetical protein [Actinomycetota bacterium]
MAAGVLLAGCSGEGEGNASPTVPSSVSTTSTTAAPDVSVIPEVIDEDYVNAVLAALDEVYGKATRIIVATKRFPPEAADLIDSIYANEEFEHEANIWLQSLALDPELRNFRSEPGNRKTTVERIIAASPSCVWIAVRRDRSPANFDPGRHRTEYLALQPVDHSKDQKGLNPTAWMITTEGLRSDGTEPDNPCPGS